MDFGAFGLNPWQTSLWRSLQVIFFGDSTAAASLNFRTVVREFSLADRLGILSASVPGINSDPVIQRGI